MLANLFDRCRRCISARLREIVRQAAAVAVNNVERERGSGAPDSCLYLAVRTTEFRIIPEITMVDKPSSS